MLSFPMRSLTLLLLLSTLDPAAVLSQCAPNDLSAVFSTAPERPTSRDTELALKFSGSSSSTCVPQLDHVERVGDLFVVHATQPTAGCGAAITRYSVEVEVGGLPSGSYRARFEVDNRSCVFPVRSFRVEPGSSRLGDGLAATLLFPYFRIDLADPRGDGTLFGIGNRSADWVVVNAVLWTDWGVPTLSFQMGIGPNAVQPLSLRPAFEEGRFPNNACSSGVIDPPYIGPWWLGEEGRRALVAAHTGQPHPADGLCWGSGREGDQVATGYLTVDVLQRCPGGSGQPGFTEAFPTHPSYFAADSGLASNRNVLLGDLYQVDEAGSNAQGLEAIAIPTDADVSYPTFYGRFSGGRDGRAPLGSRYRARFLNGGGFDGTTDLIVWLDAVAEPRPSECGQRRDDLATCRYAVVQFFDEAGIAEASYELNTTESVAALRIGGDELPTNNAFGSVEIANRSLGACILIPTGEEPEQAMLVPILRSRDRFSVGLRATRVE